MKRKCIAVLFGGVSSEHEISRISAESVLKNICKEKYDVIRIGITKFNQWFLYNGPLEKIGNGEWEDDPTNKTVVISTNDTVKGVIVINNENFHLINVDVVFPVLHGKNGEDGTIQGLLELSGIPFVGCDTNSSSSCMDKVTTNIILTNNGISKPDFISLWAYEFIEDPEKTINDIKDHFKGFPLFVKPSRAGSSIGVSKVMNESELLKAINLAIKEDSKILIEEFISGQEVECAVLGNEYPISSIVGEIAPSNEFYDYNAKYLNSLSKLFIPAHIDKGISEEICNVSIKAYKIMGCAGLSRVDFFVENGTNKVILNEINTLPGFTSISMYPKLFEAIGIPYKDLIDRLIDLAIERAIKNG